MLKHPLLSYKSVLFTPCLHTRGRYAAAHQVHHHGEVIDRRLLVSHFVDADLGVGHTTAVPRFDEGFVLLEAVATSRSFRQNQLRWSREAPCDQASVGSHFSVHSSHSRNTK